MNFYWCIALARARPGLVRGSNEENLLKKVRKMGMTDIKGEAVTAMTGNFFFLLFAWTFTVWVVSRNCRWTLCRARNPDQNARILP